MPPASPVAGRLVFVAAELMVTLFDWLSAAPVILARLLTETSVLTRYAVPVSVLCTTAFSEVVMVAVVTLAVGAEVSTVELELLDDSSFSPQEMMVRLKHEIRKMFINFFIFVPLKILFISTNKDEVILPNLLAMSSSYFTESDPEC